MKSYRKRVSVFILTNRHIILGKRFDDVKNGSLKYFLPGGGVEDYEDILKAGRREVLEELGIDTIDLKFISDPLVIDWKEIYGDDIPKSIKIDKDYPDGIKTYYLYGKIKGINKSKYGDDGDEAEPVKIPIEKYMKLLQNKIEVSDDKTLEWRKKWWRKELVILNSLKNR